MSDGIDVHDDEEDDLPCFRHPDRLTALRCLECDRPICVDCAVYGAVGIKCPEHARTSRAARGAIPTARLASGILAAVALSMVAGFLLQAFHVAFFGIILAYVVGIGIGELSRRAAGGFRDPSLARGVSSAVFFCFLAFPVADVLLSGHSLASAAPSLVWDVLAAVAAAVAAHQRSA